MVSHLSTDHVLGLLEMESLSLRVNTCCEFEVKHWAT